MEALLFPSEEALHVALRSGLIPAEVQRAPARVSYADDGQVVIAPSVSFSAKAKKSLKNSGVTETGSAPALSRAITCWAEALMPRVVGEPQGTLAQVLFTVDSEGTLLALAGELLRLGCDRQELRMARGSWRWSGDLDGLGCRPSMVRSFTRARSPRWAACLCSIARRARPGVDRGWLRTPARYGHRDAPERHGAGA